MYWFRSPSAFNNQIHHPGQRFPSLCTVPIYIVLLLFVGQRLEYTARCQGEASSPPSHGSILNAANREKQRRRIDCERKGRDIQRLGRLRAGDASTSPPLRAAARPSATGREASSDLAADSSPGRGASFSCGRRARTGRRALLRVASRGGGERGELGRR